MKDYIPIILAGFSSGTTPCMFAVIMFFGMVIFFVCRAYLSIVVWRRSFLSGMVIGVLAGNHGMLDGMHAFLSAEHIVSALYIVLGAIAFVLGAIHLFDWWQCSIRQAQQNIVLPVRFFDEERNINTRYLICSGVFGGLCCAMLSLACINQIYLPMTLDVFVMQGFLGKAVAYSVLYNSMMLAPFLIVYGSTALLLRSSQSRMRLGQQMSKVKIIVSAFLFGVGFGFLYLIIR